MRGRVLMIAATISLLGACGQAEDRSNGTVANGPATSSSDGPAAPAVPVGAEEAQKLFHERHEGMEHIGDATKAINRQLKSDAPDLAVIRTSAATINDLARKSANWFPAGTGQDVLPKTRALPAIWQKPEDFAAKDRDLREAAEAFHAAAQAGDLTQVNDRFEALGKTCKACHDTYRAEKHPK